MSVQMGSGASGCSWLAILLFRKPEDKPNFGGSAAWPLGFQFCGKLLAELGDLGRDHGHAVTLPGIVAEVLLMIILGTVERRRRRDFRNNGLVPDLGSIQFLDAFLGDTFLFRTMVKNRRAVL